MQLVHKPRNHSVCHSKYYQYWFGQQRAALCFFPRLQTFMGYLDSIHSGALQAAPRCGLRLGVCENDLVSDLGGQDKLDRRWYLPHDVCCLRLQTIYLACTDLKAVSTSQLDLACCPWGEGDCTVSTR